MLLNYEMPLPVRQIWIWYAKPVNITQKRESKSQVKMVSPLFYNQKTWGTRRFQEGCLSHTESVKARTHEAISGRIPLKENRASPESTTRYLPREQRQS